MELLEIFVNRKQTSCIPPSTCVPKRDSGITTFTILSSNSYISRGLRCTSWIHEEFFFFFKHTQNTLSPRRFSVTGSVPSENRVSFSQDYYFIEFYYLSFYKILFLDTLYRCPCEFPFTYWFYGNKFFFKSLQLYLSFSWGKSGLIPFNTRYSRTRITPENWRVTKRLHLLKWL